MGGSALKLLAVLFVLFGKWGGDGVTVPLAPGDQPAVEHVWVSTDPAVPVAGRPTTVYVYTYAQEIQPGYPWDLRVRPVSGGDAQPVALQRLGDEPAFWQGTLIFPSAGDWQIVVGAMQGGGAWPAPGTTPGNVVVPVVPDNSALSSREVFAPWPMLIATGGVGVGLGALLGWLLGRGRGRV